MATTYVTKRYVGLVDRARRTLRDADASGWIAAKVTHDAVTYLMEKCHTTKGRALQMWSHDVGRAKFSPTSARRYFDLWERYGNPDLRERNGNNKVLEFKDHYEIIRGGAPARERILKARMNGSVPPE